MTYSVSTGATIFSRIFSISSYCARHLGGSGCGLSSLSLIGVLGRGLALDSFLTLGVFCTDVPGSFFTGLAGLLPTSGFTCTSLFCKRVYLRKGVAGGSDFTVVGTKDAFSVIGGGESDERDDEGEASPGLTACTSTPSNFRLFLGGVSFSTGLPSSLLSLAVRCGCAVIAALAEKNRLVPEGTTEVPALSTLSAATWNVAEVRLSTPAGTLCGSREYRVTVGLTRDLVVRRDGVVSGGVVMLERQVRAVAWRVWRVDGPKKLCRTALAAVDMMRGSFYRSAI